MNTAPTETAQPNNVLPPAAAKPTSTALAVAPQDGAAISVFASAENFTAGQRMAKALSDSSLVPEVYRNNLPNVLIALELASRIGASALMVMQSLDIVHGRPSWRSSFLIATTNACGKFTPLRFRWQGTEGTDSWGCRAVAKDRSDGEECLGPLITIALAKGEGWVQRKGSKWQTLPELMLCYRAAAFWTRLFCPELSLGIRTSEETQDVETVDMPSQARAPSTADLERKLREAPAATMAPIKTEPAKRPSVPPAETPVAQALAGNEMPAGWGGEKAEPCLVCGKAASGQMISTTTNDGVVGTRHEGCSPFGAGGSDDPDQGP